jgi:signal transduction histidine kinase
MESAKTPAESLLWVLNGILHFAKTEAGNFVLEPTLFCLWVILCRTLKIRLLQAQPLGLTLTAELSVEVPSVLVGDLTHLRQIVVNRMGSATKWTEQGEVSISVNLES